MRRKEKYEEMEIMKRMLPMDVYFVNIQNKINGGMITVSRDFSKIILGEVYFGYLKEENSIIIKKIEKSEDNDAKIINFKKVELSARASNKQLVGWLKSKGFVDRVYFQYNAENDVFVSTSDPKNTKIRKIKKNPRRR